MGENFKTAGRTQLGSSLHLRLATTLAAAGLLVGACGSAPSVDVVQGVAAISMTDATTAAATPTPITPAVATVATVATVAVVATSEPELPPARSEDGDPITDNIVMSEALGLVDVCSLYEEPSRLSELLGEFWTMTNGIPVDQKCLWVSSKDSESSAVVSIEILAADGSDNSANIVGSDSIGTGLAVSVDGTEYTVNVVTDEVDAALAELNVREAEERIVADILARTGS